MGSIPVRRATSEVNFMYNVIWKDADNRVCDKQFSDLTPAMAWARELGVFVTITGGEFDIVGVLGADAVVDGRLPDGNDYTWKKRRR
ncbi:hypothetical protein UFOVP190_154 [uncultured Caudovirales phage]|uniref:Uncharacterized protein n=1 Tax=uncultured Caudovirales phage TaxID=2100421 RepID=A0A6J7WLY3_9CAUD|nr:hypothetical protein UFOVP190_154 [uncultured Caudovirales phage]